MNKYQDLDEIEFIRKGKMTQNLNPGASEQMLEKLSDEELKDLVEKRFKLNQKTEQFKFIQLEAQNAQLEFDKSGLLLKMKYGLKDQDQVNLETGLITRS